MIIKYQDDTELQLKGFITLYKLRRRRTDRRSFLIFIAFILYCTFLYLTESDRLLGYFITFSFAWCLFQFSTYFNTLNMYRKLFRQRGPSGEISYNIEKELMVYKDSGSEIRQDWSGLKGTLLYREFLFILPRNSLSLMFWIHKDNIGQEDFRKFTREVRQYLPSLSIGEI